MVLKMSFYLYLSIYGVVFLSVACGCDRQSRHQGHSLRFIVWLICGALFHVAATRAVRYLYISSHGAASEYLRAYVYPPN